MLELFALIVIGVLIGATIWIVVTLGSLPGKMARAEQHPQAEAITLLGWLGLLTLGIGWFIALVWAKAKPIAPGPEIGQKLDQLEARVEQLEVNKT